MFEESFDLDTVPSSTIPKIIVTFADTPQSFSRSFSSDGKPKTKSKSTPKSSIYIPYTPPDSLMFPLIDALQRKAWNKARSLTRELILCDLKKEIYVELYSKLDRIIKVKEPQFKSPWSTFETLRESSSETTDSES